MQSAKFSKRLLQLNLIAVAVIMASGCGSNSLLKKMTQNDKIAIAKPATTKSAEKIPEPTSATPVMPATPATPASVSPAAQQAFELANKAYKAGHTDQAERGYRALTISDPALAGPHANLGLLYREANKPKDSLDELSQAVQLSPKQATYWNQLGVTYRQLGQFEQAQKAYEQAIALDTNYANAILNLGILADMYQGDGKRALDLYTRYITLTPGGDAVVNKWIAELKNRKPAAVAKPTGTPPKEKS